MAVVLMPVPARDSDPTEVAVTWKVLTTLGHRVVFATPDGEPAGCDEIMVTGRGLDPWGFVPGLDRLVLVGRVLRADRAARSAHAALQNDPNWRCPLSWAQLELDSADGLFLPGGHRARGMRPYLESRILQSLVVRAFATELPVAAICHGVLLAARSIDPQTGHSVLYGRRTTALTWPLESAADQVARWTRFWDRDYYRTYREQPGEPAGHMSVQQEVTRALAAAADFLDVPANGPDAALKSRGFSRDRLDNPRPAWVVDDGRYLSARWPGDAHTLAARFGALLS